MVVQDILWLLLPIAAASGWYAARRSAPPVEEQQRDYTPAYFKGLNYLLNEQPDKAIDVFVQMLEVDSDTVETHLALGNLFRRRGEVDRAIRIHQNLIARPRLTREHRAQALLELGQDYMRAGLFDRAENLFNELVEMKSQQELALRNLLIIFQQEKEWEKCLQTANRLGQISGKSFNSEQAYFHCELAEEAQLEGDEGKFVQHLKSAQSCDADCVRATLLQGKQEVGQDACRSAIQTLQRVERQDPDYLPEALPLLLECYRRIGDRKALSGYLHELYQRNQGTGPALALVDLIQAEDGDAAALEFLTRYLQKRPDIEGIDRLITLSLNGVEGSAAETLQLLRRLLSKLLAARLGYQCNHCGFMAKTLHWQCPSCHFWGSIKPVQRMGEEKRWMGAR
ncbi:MAG: lipopolysaccharide assembly protein LapB [Chromatiaceae bacterium]|nr:lipopolysaccharide assembly protein LapB [Chromatiaceae bacterium]